MKPIIAVMALSLSATLAQAEPNGCRTWGTGEDVVTRHDAGLTHLGGASVESGNTVVITTNRDILSQQSELVQEFWYSFECARFHSPPREEDDYMADCMAVREIRDMEILPNESDFKQLVADLKALPDKMWPGRKPDEVRLQNMEVCFGT